MNIARRHALALAAAGCAALLSSHAAAQKAEDEVRFAAPKRIHAGDAFLGEGRLYPSPALHDVDGDQRPDLVIGDLFGRVTVAHRAAGDAGPSFGAEKKLKAANGKPLKFHNW